MAESGGRAVLGRLRDLAPKRSAQSATAKFRALARSGRGYGYLTGAGVNATARTQQNWISGDATPNKANREAIDRAYQDWQRDNLASRATKAGRTIEVYPDPAIVRQARGAISAQPVKVTLTPAEWRAMADAERKGDTAAADRVWRGAIAREIIGSPPARTYASVGHVWF